MGQSELGLCGRFALFHIVDSNSKKFYLCKILDAQVGYLLLQGWSLHKNKKLLELPALYPISLIAVGKNRTPWAIPFFSTLSGLEVCDQGVRAGDVFQRIVAV